jgi:serine/threonine protein kinase/tetratricopeptide (TPR) repeat protein
MVVTPGPSAPSPEARDSDGSASQLIEQLAADMAERWRQGERPLAEDYLARHPGLAQKPESAIDLIYEELCLRQEHTAGITASELCHRFPQWQSQLAVLLTCHEALQADLAPPAFPEPGEKLGDFELLSELGRGARSRVYLATQASLAERPVVVKVTPPDGREHVSLARLQHTHIVPLYSVQGDPARHLRLLCMPYFGGATLDRLFALLAPKPLVERRGQDLLRGLDGTASAAAAAQTAGPNRDYLARASYVQAVCWIGAQLAGALQYAHERGLVHFDVKPSNVLLAADGKPMLLDFHLARPPLLPGGPPVEWVGGTAGYMSPEQQQAVEALRQGRPVPVVVDGRSDVYSLGLLLYEALSGPIPLPAAGPPRLEKRNPQVSQGLADIIHKAINPRASDRYSSAAALAADLGRHLADLPLRGVANRSWAERWRKWRRRRPHALRVVNLALAVLLAALAVGVFLALSFNERVQEANTHLARARQMRAGNRNSAALEILRHGLAVAQSLPFNQHLQQELGEELRRAVEQELHEARGLLDRGRRCRDSGQNAEAIAALKQGLASIQDLPDGAYLTRAFEDQIRLTERAMAAGQLHVLVDGLRFHYGENIGIAALAWQGAEAQCQGFWQKRAWLLQATKPDLAPVARQQIREDLLDLAVLWSDLQAAINTDRAAGARAALVVLHEAERQLGPSRVLCRERQRHAAALGLTAEAEAAARQGASLEPHTPWEQYALGRSLLREGHYHLAATALRQAVFLRPESLWASFYSGICAMRLGQYQDAVAAFSACVSLAPSSGRCLSNRGLAYARLGRADRALQDYDQALRLEPGLAAAALNRGLLHLEARRAGQAIADFQLALKCGADPGSAYYYLALAHRARGDRAAALVSLRQALRHAPQHAEARQLMKKLQGDG